MIVESKLVLEFSRNRSVVALGLFLTILLGACGVSCGQENFKVCLINITAHGHVYQFFTDTKTLERTPAWQPSGGDDPPLRSSAAVKIARDAAKQQFPDAEEIQIDSIELTKNASHHEVNTSIEPLLRWYYVVRYSPKIGGKFKHGDPLGQVAVLLDGSVVNGEMTK